MALLPPQAVIGPTFTSGPADHAPHPSTPPPPGSRPLVRRLERERLLALFHNEILPNHRVEVDVLCRGVTRSAIRERITAAGGYHVAIKRDSSNFDPWNLR